MQSTGHAEHANATTGADMQPMTLQQKFKPEGPKYANIPDAGGVLPHVLPYTPTLKTDSYLPKKK